MTTGLLDEVIARVKKKPRTVRRNIVADALESTKGMLWVPNPGPQKAAFLSEADETGYGGELGGGKTGLLVGLSLTNHRHSLILRRTNKEAEKLVNEYEAILGNREGWNGRGTWRLPGRLIDLGGCEHEHDKQKRKGFDHDLKGFDQVEDFTESQYTFIIGWNRSIIPGQRCRVVATFNPPTRPEGLWIIKRWAAWLDPRHPHPAKPGELRWYTTINGKDTEVDGPGPHLIEGEKIMAKSRTFIRAHLSDNPDLAKTDYASTLAALPEDLRIAYKGGSFSDALRDDPHQIIPTAWIREAQMRWSQWDGKPPPGVPMCAISVDCSGGGRDPLVVGARYDGWFAPFEVTEGKDIPEDRIGRYTAGVVISHRRDQAVIVVDMGGGYGGAAYEHLKTNLETDRLTPVVIGFKGAEATTRRTHDKLMSFKNKRTEAIWRLREALDPGQVGGSPIMLPDDTEMVADLTAVTFEVVGSTIVAESKEDVCARLARSTDKGDTVCMCWNAGPTASTDGAIWDEQRRQMMPLGRRPQVIKSSRYGRR